LLALAVLAPAPAQAQEPDPSIPDAEVGAGDPTAGTTDSTEPPPDDQPPPPPALDPSPHVRVLVAHFAITDAQAALAFAQAGLDDARDAAALAEAAVRQDEQNLDAQHASLEAAQRELQEFSVGLFIHADGGITTNTELDQFGVFEQRTTKQLTDSVIDHLVAMVEEAKDRITSASLALDQSRQAAFAAGEVVAQHESAFADAAQHLRDAEQELRDAQRADVLVPFERDPDDEGELRDEDEERANDARLVSDTGRQHQWELLIEGGSIFTPEELAAWFVQRQVIPPRARAPVEDLARFFVEEGATEGIRGDVAFAQAILETGSFTNDDTINYNNYAGVGHCDSCPSGWNFSTPQDGVRAQIQLLKSYVYEKPEYQNDLVDKRLRGPAGCCQTWNELSGVWATGGGYGAHIMRIYQEMLEWLYQQRTGTPPPPPPDSAPPG
jgi:hypothetical protein